MLTNLNFNIISVIYSLCWLVCMLAFLYQFHNLKTQTSTANKVKCISSWKATISVSFPIKHLTYHASTSIYWRLTFLYLCTHYFIIIIYSTTVVPIFPPLPSSAQPTPCSHSQSPHSVSELRVLKFNILLYFDMAFRFTFTSHYKATIGSTCIQLTIEFPMYNKPKLTSFPSFLHCDLLF